jgi:mono/diheme cytochrome c family protein
LRSSIWFICAVLLFWPGSAIAQDGEAPKPSPSGEAASGDSPIPEASLELFVQKCASCHSVGEGNRVGPDLKGAHERRDDAWLRTMIQFPGRLLDSDGDARSLVTEFKGVRMPDLGLTNEQVDLIVELITVCSATKCDLKGKFVAVTKATPADVALGVALFLGRTPFENGGPACVSCHTMEGVGGLIEGGTLAKELTHSFASLGDEGLDAALKNPTFAVMNKVYGDAPLNGAEAFALRAALYDANRGALKGGGQRINVVWLAALIALLSLAGLNAAWSRRKRQGIRETLVAKEQQS